MVVCVNSSRGKDRSNWLPCDAYYQRNLNKSWFGRFRVTFNSFTYMHLFFDTDEKTLLSRCFQDLIYVILVNTNVCNSKCVNHRLRRSNTEICLVMENIEIGLVMENIIT